MSLIAELRKRNVFRAAVAYAIVWWLLVQVAGLLLDAFEAPGWIFRALILLLAIGFPVAVVLAWFFELTPGGLVRNEDLPLDPAQAKAVARYLNPLIIGMLSAAVILFALDKFYWTEEPPRSDSGRHSRAEVSVGSIAVLPFANRSSVAEDAWFVDGIHDDLLTMLAKIDAFRVVSRTSVQRYRGSEKNIGEIGRELDVDFILEGGVQRAGNSVRINAQLIDARSDEHLWAETFDRELSTESLFSIQSEIARAIAAALDARLSVADKRRLDTVPTRSLGAYDAYLLGRQGLLVNSAESYQAALGHFERAIALDGGFAAAFAGACEAHLGLYSKSGDTHYFEAAETACTRALALDAERAEVHVALGTLFRHHGDYPRAEMQLRRALAIEPQNVDAVVELGLVLALLGRREEAKSALLNALELQPDHWPVHDALFTYYRSHDDQPERLDLAVKHAMRVVELTPDSAAAWNNLGTAYHGLQQYQAAKTAWDRALELAPTRTAYTNRGLQYYYEGRFADAAEMQLKAVELAPSDHRAWGRLAEAYRLMGNGEEASQSAYARAIGLAEAQLEVNPQDWRTHGLLATYYAHSGRGEEAAARIESALAISERDAEALLYAALVAHERGDGEATLSALEEMIERDPTFRDYAKQDPDLVSLSGHPRFERIIHP
jgi:TolB-like protein/Flp pilus assembly protein TadD